MDGWETRRRRTPGYDWCLIRLGAPGIVRGVVVDTSFFKGNYPEHFSLEGCDLGDGPPYKNEKARLRVPDTQWAEFLPKTALKGDSLNMFPVAAHVPDDVAADVAAADAPADIPDNTRFTHLRFRIFPMAASRACAYMAKSFPTKSNSPNLKSILARFRTARRIIASSDRFFGEPLNLLMPGSAREHGRRLGDAAPPRSRTRLGGREARRSRNYSQDRSEHGPLQRKLPGKLFPRNRQRGRMPLANSDRLANVERAFARHPAEGEFHHIFRKLITAESATHIRFNIYPDGGVARLRLFGARRPCRAFPGGIESFNRLTNERAKLLLLDCCGSPRWAEQMLAHKPFSSVKHLLDLADRSWTELGREDWLEAFRHHPAIGSKNAKKAQSGKARQWSAGEQSVAQKASAEISHASRPQTAPTKRHFGHVFLICATGKTSAEILESLQQRLTNGRDTEVRNAAEEQRKITRLRLEKLLAS